MGRLLKLVAAAIGVLVLLLVAAAVAIVLLVDPNDYKDEITAAVARATGRELTLEGDLELDLFPVLRISLGSARLSNAEGFGDEPFALIDRAGLELEVLPLLARRIEISEAQLEGLVLNLARDAQGRNNWQDLGGAGAPAETPAEAEDGGPGGIDLNVEEIRILDSEVVWTDAANASRWTLGGFDFEASGFGPSVAFPMAMSFDLSGADVEVSVDARTRATLSLAENTYRLEDLRVTLAGEGGSWPGGEGEAQLRFAAFTANLEQETLDLDQLTLELLGVTVNGSLEGRGLLSDLTLNGRVEIEPFDPGRLLEAFGAAVETADPTVLRQAAAEAGFAYGASRIGLDDMRLVLDDSELSGSVGLEGDTLGFELSVNEINIDRYLPPPAEQAAAAEEEGSIDEVDLPLDVLRTLDASGSLAFGTARFAGVTLTNAAFTLRAGGGRVTLAPRANLYGGTLSGEIGLEVGSDAAQASVTSALANVDLLPLGRDLLESEMVSGRGDLRLNLTTSGSNVGQMRRDLDGDVAFTLADGAWEGIDLWYELVRARAVFDGQSPPARPEGPPRTPFSSVSASGVVADALLTNRDLNATLPFMTVDGEGMVNLLTDEIDFDLVATFVDGPMLQSEPLMARLAGEQLPLVVSGTVAEPSVLPDFAALIRARAREAVTEELEEERTEVDQRLEEERGEVEERIETEREALRERLRGLFDR